MTKQERVKELTEALENNWANEYEVLTYPEIAEALVNAGYGNLREFKTEIINLYLKGDITGLLKVLQEEV